MLAELPLLGDALDAAMVPGAEGDGGAMPARLANRGDEQGEAVSADGPRFLVGHH